MIVFFQHFIHHLSLVKIIEKKQYSRGAFNNVSAFNSSFYLARRFKGISSSFGELKFILRNEPRCEKTGLRGFRPGPTQTGLYRHRRSLET